MADTAQSSDDNATMIHWTPELEEYFASTGEKAHCLAWVHKKSEELYSNRRTYIDMPVIILSSVTGFCSVGSSTMFAGNVQLASVILGISSLFVSVLNTTGSYFGWAKRGEGHRISAIHYAKLYRFLCVELKLPREERMSVHDLLKYVKDKYDSLAETSPLVPEIIIRDFRSKFSGKEYDEVSKPEEANGLEKITVYGEEGSKKQGPPANFQAYASSLTNITIPQTPGEVSPAVNLPMFKIDNPMLAVKKHVPETVVEVKTEEESPSS